jgi:hypothetical protein
MPARFRLVQGVDLTGMQLGAQRRAAGAAPLLSYVLERCPHLKRLRLQVCRRDSWVVIVVILLLLAGLACGGVLGWLSLWW